MSIFKYNERYKAYVAELNGVRFCCMEEKEGYERQAQMLADAYEEKIHDIISFIIDEVCSMFGDVTKDELTDALGTPLIDLDREVISYLEQSLDDVHIIDVEFSGLLDEFYEIVIDG